LPETSFSGVKKRERHHNLLATTRKNDLMCPDNQVGRTSRKTRKVGSWWGKKRGRFFLRGPYGQCRSQRLWREFERPFTNFDAGGGGIGSRGTSPEGQHYAMYPRDVMPCKFPPEEEKNGGPFFPLKKRKQVAQLSWKKGGARKPGNMEGMKEKNRGGLAKPRRYPVMLSGRGLCHKE